MKYQYTIEHRNNKMQVDDNFQDWITASSEFDARKQIEKAYPKDLGYNCILINEIN